MKAVPLQSDKWADYFLAIRCECGPVLAMVSLQPDRSDSQRAGAVVERTLRAIRYDTRRDVLELSAGGAAGRGPALRYFICTPRQILVEEAPGTTGILIEDASGQRTEIGLRRVSVTRAPSLDPMLMSLAQGAPRPFAQRCGEHTARRSICAHSRPAPSCRRQTYARGTRRGTH
jgi:hypothetical protein